MCIRDSTNEERNFIYGYKDKLLSLHKDKDYNGLDVECIEGSPVIDEICRYGKEHHIIQIKERRIDVYKRQVSVFLPPKKHMACSCLMFLDSLA